ncbi:MAG: macro domain-containing protein, partial [Gammaproteobacteria bacterium]|nr:macro domain-containing protein [Gammaproteobacteria bacterium]
SRASPATGEARLSPGFKLPAKYVISTVGPVWYGGERGEAALLENAYRNSFILALQHGIKSIAFPAISTGVYAYPKEMAARIALAVMKEYENKFEQIIVACHTIEDVEIYEAVLAELD